MHEVLNVGGRGHVSYLDHAAPIPPGVSALICSLQTLSFSDCGR